MSSYTDGVSVQHPQSIPEEIGFFSIENEQWVTLYSAWREAMLLAGFSKSNNGIFSLFIRLVKTEIIIFPFLSFPEFYSIYALS